MVILKVFLVGLHARTYMNIILAHVLVDGFVSQVIDIDLSTNFMDTGYEHGVGLTQLETYIDNGSSLSTRR
jgi:hypothetical protein